MKTWIATVPLVVLAAAACNGPVYEHYDPQVADLLVRIEALEAEAAEMRDQVGEDADEDIAVEVHIAILTEENRKLRADLAVLQEQVDKLQDQVDDLMELLVPIDDGDEEWRFTKPVKMPGLVVEGNIAADGSIQAKGEIRGESGVFAKSLSAAEATFAVLTTTGASTFDGLVTATGGISVTKGAFEVLAGTSTLAELKVTDTATFAKLITANNGLTVASGALNVLTGKTTLQDLDVRGVLTYSGALKLTSLIVDTLDVGLGGVDSAGDVTTAGDLLASGDVTVRGDVSAANVDVVSNLNTGALTVETTASFGGNATFRDDVEVKGDTSLAKVTAGSTTVGDLIATSVTADEGTFAVAATVAGADLDGRLDVLAERADDLEDDVSALELGLENVLDLDPFLQVVGKEIRLIGANLSIRSGSGSTEGTVNGLGNLILGYNESSVKGGAKTGSHNLILGTGSGYTSFGGIVGGRDNRILNGFAVVLSGTENTVEGSNGIILTGFKNLNSPSNASTSVIIGGKENTVGHDFSVVLGGVKNVAARWEGIYP